MEEQQFHDPFGEAFLSVGERITQMVSLSASALQILVDRQAAKKAAEAEQNERLYRWYEQQEKFALDKARKVWGPALDVGWLKDADLIDTARAWGAAMPYGVHAEATEKAARAAEAEADRLQTGPDPGPYQSAAEHARRARDAADYARDAAEAMKACEARLREMHPHAMRYYDWMRSAGFSPVDAMWAAAPHFNRHPNSRTVEPQSRLEPGKPQRALGPGTGEPQPGPTPYWRSLRAWKEWHTRERTRVRARAAITRLEDRARGNDRAPLGREALQTALESDVELTTLPTSELDALVEEHLRARAAAQGQAAYEQAAAAMSETERAVHLGRAVDDPATAPDERSEELARAGRSEGAAATRAARARAARGSAPDMAGLGFPRDIDTEVRHAAARGTTPSAMRKQVPTSPYDQRRGPGH